MFIKRKSFWPSFSVAIVASIVPLSVYAQHVHGVVDVGIVVENQAVAISLNAPMSDVVGFEHSPENDSQTESLERATALLADANRMFGLAASASCEVTAVTVDGPEYMILPSTASDTDSHDHESDHDDSAHHGHDHEAHSGEADHDHDSAHEHDDASMHDESGHDDHDHESGQHADIVANYEWTCADVSSLGAVELRFAKGFASIEEINVQILTESGTQLVSADASTESVSLNGP